MAEDWQDGKTLSECNLYMLSHEVACDVTFLVGEQEEPVMAHTFILESRASKLRELYADQKKFTSKLVIVPDLKIEPFRLLLRYVYSGDLDLTTNQALSLLPLADKYGPESLMKRCFEKIMGDLTAESACDILEKCHEYGKDFFFNECLNFIFINAKEVLMSRGLRQLCNECLDSVVKADELNADEMTVFNALVFWASSQCSKRKVQATDKNIRQMLGNLVFHARFAAMSVAEFTEKVSVGQILTSEEKIKIYQYHHGTRLKLPTQFLTEPRKAYRNACDQITVDNSNDTAPEPKRPTSEEKIKIYQNHHGTQMKLPTHFLTEPRQAHKNTSDQISMEKSNDIAPEPKRLLDYDDVVSITKPRDRFLKVNRFQTVKGTWKNNGPDAITFKCSKPIALHGIQVYSSYKGSKSFNLEVSIFSQIGYQIRKEKYQTDCQEGSRLSDVLFYDPIRIPANQMFTIQTFSKGSPVHCGSDGITPVFVEDVRFDFTASNKSLNGTDVTIGQIPVLVFKKV